MEKKAVFTESGIYNDVIISCIGDENELLIIVLADAWNNFCFDSPFAIAQI